MDPSPKLAAVREERLPAMAKRLDMFLNEPLVPVEPVLDGALPDVSGESVMPPSGEAPAAMRETKKDSLVGVTQTIPAGEHWIVGKDLGSNITVLPGAKLTITDATGTEILVHEGGEVSIIGEDLGSTIEYVKPDTSPVAGENAHTRATLPDASTAVPASPEPAPDSVPDSMTNTPPAEKGDDGRGTGKNLSQRRRAQMKPKASPASSKSEPTGSQDLSPSEPDPMTVSDTPEADPNEIIIKDKQIERLLADYEERPECQTLLSELEALKGTNPDEKVIANIRMQLQKLAPAVTDPTLDQPSESVQPVRRNVDVPVTDASSPQPDSASTGQSDPALSPDAGVIASPGAPSVDVDTVGTSVDGGRKEKKETWTKQRLLAEIKEGVTFTLFDSNGNQLPGDYIRKGGRFLKGKNGSKDHWKDITKTLSFGGRWERKGATAAVAPKLASADVPDATVPATPAHPDKPVDVPPTPTAAPDKAGNVSDPKPADATVAPATPVAPTMSPATPDATFDKSKEKIRLPNDGEELYYSTTNGRVVVGYSLGHRGDNRYSITNIDVPGFDEDDLVSVAMSTSYNYTADEILLKAKEQGWKLIDAPVTVPKASVDVPVPPAMPPAPDRASGEKLRFTPLKKGEEAFYQGKNGGVTVKALDDDWYQVIYPSGTTVGCEGDQVERFAKKDEWVPTAEPPVTQEKQENFELATGDTFVARGADGSLKRVRITAVFEDKNNDSWVDFLTEWEEKGIIKTESHNLKPEKAKQLLRDGNYVREGAATPDALGDKKKSTDLPVLNDALYEKVIDLAPGEEGTYRTSDPALPTVRIKRVGDQYQMIGADGKPVAGSRYSERELQQLAKVENWQKVEVPSTPSNEKIIPPEEKEAEKNLESLLAEVKEARLDYVRTDYHQKKAWNRVAEVIRSLRGAERHDQDTDAAKARYERALSKLYDFRLGKLKQSGVSGSDLHTQMGEMLIELKRDEPINLSNDRTKVEYENMNLPKKVKKVFEEVGKAYNKLKPETKVFLAVAVLGGSAGLGAAVGAAGAAVGVGMIGARRVITTLGAGAALDMWSAQKVEKKRQEKAVKEQEEQIKELEDLIGAPLTMLGKNEGIPPEMFEQLSENVADDIKSLDRKFQKQKQMKFWRKAAVWGAAVGASAFFMHQSPGSGDGTGSPKESLEERARRINLRESGGGVSGAGADAQPGKPVIPAAAEAASAPASAAESAQSVTSPAIATPESGAPADVKSAALEKVGGLLQDHTVEAADGKRGLWGILDKRLPSSIPEGPDRNRILASIENVMRRDLANMSPAEQAAAGFPKGSLDLIYAGDVIQFDKFPSLTAEKLQAIMDGESVGAPSSMIDVTDGVAEAEVSSDADAVDQAARETVTNQVDQVVAAADHPTPKEGMTKAVPEATVKQPEVPKSSSIIDQLTLQNIGSVTTADLLNADIPEPTGAMQSVDFEEYLEEHPEMEAVRNHTLKGMKEALFSLPVDPYKVPQMVPSDGGYNLSRQGMSYMEQALETHDDLRSGKISQYEYDRRNNAFKSSQIERLARLVRVATDPQVFGAAGRVLPGERVNEYLERMAATATVTHKGRLLMPMLYQR